MVLLLYCCGSSRLIVAVIDNRDTHGHLIVSFGFLLLALSPRANTLLSYVNHNEDKLSTGEDNEDNIKKWSIHYCCTILLYTS